VRGGRSTTLQVRGLEIESLFFPSPHLDEVRHRSTVLFIPISVLSAYRTNTTVHRAVSMAVASYYKNAYIILYLILFFSVCRNILVLVRFRVVPGRRINLRREGRCNGATVRENERDSERERGGKRCTPMFTAAVVCTV